MQRFIFLSLLLCDSALPFSPRYTTTTTPHARRVVRLSAAQQHDQEAVEERPWRENDWKKVAMGCVVGLGLTLSALTTPVFAYDGFAEYAQDNQMEKSDVGCFVNKCGDQTKDLFKNPRGIKGVSCLGRCKGEQSCAMQCFAEFGSPSLDDWLSCAIEENACVKMPAAIDNSAENIGYKYSVPNFDPKSLVGSWYKTDVRVNIYELCTRQSPRTHTFSPRLLLLLLPGPESQLRSLSVSNEHVQSNFGQGVGYGHLPPHPTTGRIRWWILGKRAIGANGGGWYNRAERAQHAHIRKDAGFDV